MLVFLGEGKPEFPEKTSRSNKLNPHLTPDLGIEPGPHWWEASALTTAPSLHPANSEAIRKWDKVMKKISFAASPLDTFLRLHVSLTGATKPPDSLLGQTKLPPPLSHYFQDILSLTRIKRDLLLLNS